MFCNKCGKEIKAGNNFCENCGAKVVKVEINPVVNKSKKKSKKALIISLSIVLGAIVLFVGGFLLYQRISVNREIESFSNEVMNMEEAIDKLSLGDYKDEYEKLIKECDKIISSKDVDRIQYIKEEFTKLKKKINEANSAEEEEEEEVDYDEDIEEEIDDEDIDYYDDIEEEDSLSNIGRNDEIENLVRTFLVNFPSAVNEGDFSIISTYLYPDSNLYNQQKIMIPSWYEQGIKEEFISFNGSEITFSEDKMEGTIISEEVFEITDPSTGTRTESFTWKYNFKYNSELGTYQLTELSNP